MTSRFANRLGCALLIAALAWPTRTAGLAALSARVSPAVALAPASVRIEVLIASHQDNRMLHIVMDSGTYLRSSSISLEGDRAARVHSVIYRGLPAGYYDVQIELVDHKGSIRAIEHHWVNLVS
jgi:hypothetical protein